MNSGFACIFADAVVSRTYPTLFPVQQCACQNSYYMAFLAGLNLFMGYGFAEFNYSTDIWLNCDALDYYKRAWIPLYDSLYINCDL